MYMHRYMHRLCDALVCTINPRTVLKHTVTARRSHAPAGGGADARAHQNAVPRAPSPQQVRKVQRAACLSAAGSRHSGLYRLVQLSATATTCGALGGVRGTAALGGRLRGRVEGAGGVRVGRHQPQRRRSAEGGRERLCCCESLREERHDGVVVPVEQGELPRRRVDGARRVDVLTLVGTRRRERRAGAVCPVEQRRDARARDEQPRGGGEEGDGVRVRQGGGGVDEPGARVRGAGGVTTGSCNARWRLAGMRGLRVQTMRLECGGRQLVGGSSRARGCALQHLGSTRRQKKEAMRGASSAERWRQRWSRQSSAVARRRVSASRACGSGGGGSVGRARARGGRESREVVGACAKGRGVWGVWCGCCPGGVAWGRGTGAMAVPAPREASRGAAARRACRRRALRLGGGRGGFATVGERRVS